VLKLGSHVSISGGYDKAVEKAAVLGCNAFQMFMRNPRSFKRKNPDTQEVEAFLKARDDHKIQSVVAHQVYASNLASNDKNFHYFTIKEFIKDIELAQLLGIKLIVTHPGSFKGGDYSQGFLRIISALKKIVKKLPEDMMILLENVSGSGHWLGSRFSEIGYIIDSLDNPDNIGLCLDTCHAWGAGYDLHSKAGLDSTLKEIDKTIGVDKIKVVHLNDTNENLGSRKDRHLGIGHGHIGYEGFSNIINHPYLKDCVFIIETPRDDQEKDDLENLNVLRKLYKRKS